MNTYLAEFLSYFFPDLALPPWMQAFVGIVCLTFFFKVIFAVLGGKNGRV